MPTENVTAKLTDGPEVTVTFNIDEKIHDAVERYGEAVVFSRYKASLVIDLQAFLRTQLKKDEIPSGGDMQAMVDSWAPGVKAKGRSPAEKARDLMSKLTEAERAELIESMGLA